MQMAKASVMSYVLYSHIIPMVKQFLFKKIVTAERIETYLTGANLIQAWKKFSETLPLPPDIKRQFQEKTTVLERTAIPIIDGFIQPMVTQCRDTPSQCTEYTKEQIAGKISVLLMRVMMVKDDTNLRKLKMIDAALLASSSTGLISHTDLKDVLNVVREVLENAKKELGFFTDPVPVMSSMTNENILQQQRLLKVLSPIHTVDSVLSMLDLITPMRFPSRIKAIHTVIESIKDTARSDNVPETLKWLFEEDDKKGLAAEAKVEVEDADADADAEEASARAMAASMAVSETETETEESGILLEILSKYDTIKSCLCEYYFNTLLHHLFNTEVALPDSLYTRDYTVIPSIQTFCLQHLQVQEEVPPDTLFPLFNRISTLLNKINQNIKTLDSNITTLRTDGKVDIYSKYNFGGMTSNTYHRTSGGLFQLFETIIASPSHSTSESVTSEQHQHLDNTYYKTSIPIVSTDSTASTDTDVAVYINYIPFKKTSEKSKEGPGIDNPVIDNPVITAAAEVTAALAPNSPSPPHVEHTPSQNNSDVTKYLQTHSSTAKICVVITPTSRNQDIDTYIEQNRVSDTNPHICPLKFLNLENNNFVQTLLNRNIVQHLETHEHKKIKIENRTQQDVKSAMANALQLKEAAKKADIQLKKVQETAKSETEKANVLPGLLPEQKNPTKGGRAIGNRNKLTRRRLRRRGGNVVPTRSIKRRNRRLCVSRRRTKIK
jgi:hypothetical protein